MGSEKSRAKSGSRDRRSKKNGSRSRDGRSKKSGSRSRDRYSKKTGSRSRDRRSKKSGSRSRDRSAKKSDSRSRDRRSRKSGSRKRDRKKGRGKSASKKRRSSSRDRLSHDKKRSRSRRKKSRSRDRRSAAGKFGASAASTEPPDAPASTVAQKPASTPEAGAVPDWLSDLMGGGSAPDPPIARSEPLQIPGALASVITNDCAAIRSVMAQTGATVSIRGDCMHLGYSLAFFTGGALAVAQAREMVQTQIGLSERTTITKEIEMSAELLAEGHVDSVLAQLQQRNTIVPITVKNTDPTKNLVKIVLGPGPVAYVSTAEALMRKKIDGWLTDGGRQLCGQWRKGNCTFGANCKFRHGLELSSRKAAVPQASQAAPALESPPPPTPAPPPTDDLPLSSQRTSATSGML